MVQSPVYRTRLKPGDSSVFFYNPHKTAQILNQNVKCKGEQTW